MFAVRVPSRLAAGLAALLILTAPRPAAGQGQPEVKFVTATALTKAFADNVDAARKAYPNFTPLVVEGVIAKLDKTEKGEPVVHLKGHNATAAVVCTFDAKQAATAKGLRVGQKVTITGAGIGNVDDQVLVIFCRLAPAGVPIPPNGKAPAVPVKKAPPADELVPKLKLTFGQKSVGLVTINDPGRAARVVGAVPNLAYISDREFGIVKLPKELLGTQAIVRNADWTSRWPFGDDLTLLKPVTVYLAALARVNAKEFLSAGQLAAFQADGWALLREPFETSRPRGETWTWRVLKKDFDAGPFAVSPPPSFRFWPAPQAVFFVRERKGPAKVARTAPTPKQPATPVPAKATVGRPATGLVKLGDGLSQYRPVELGVGLAYLTDRDYKIAKLPKEMVGAHVLVHDTGHGGWLPAGQAKMAKDAHLYVAVWTKAYGETRVSDNQLRAFEEDGWTLLKEPFVTTFPPGEGWEWKVLRKPVAAGQDNFPLPELIRNGRFDTQLIFAFKERSK
jgi:hypothetical protein